MRLGFLVLAVSIAACGARSSLRVDDGEEPRGGGGSGGGGAGQGGAGGGGEGGGVGGVEQLALGAGHSCVRTFSGDVYCWGRNGDGQLGVGHEEDTLTPEPVALDERATFLAAGSFHTCAIVESGDVYCWGRNSAGQLGNGTATSSPEPVRIAMEQVGAPMARLSLGESHSCGIANMGDPVELFCWGSSESGQIGSFDSAAVPIHFVSGANEVAAGAFHTCFVMVDGSVHCTGENSQLQTGAFGPNQVTDPVVPEGLAGVSTGVRSGRGNHTCALLPDEALHCWGENDSGQLGASASEAETPLTTPVISLPGLTDAQAGFAHTCALAGGQVLCWGLNESGQLGTAGPRHSDPIPVPGLDGVIAIGVGTIHACAMRSASEIFCWGGNDFGQLGDGTTITSNVPVPVTLP